MALQEEAAIIIADDLTGANDTALQFFKSGAITKIIIDPDYDFGSDDAGNTSVWAYSTESRNSAKEQALHETVKAAQKLQKVLNSERFYKKIDSTLRGNVGIEIVALLEVLKKDAAIVAPAYIEENRTTIGGYQLLNGIPIERTQAALDPKSPITNSCIKSILKKDLNPQLFDYIDVIDFETVTKGAGPINLKIKEFLKKGRKILILDAVSTVDMEQIALAIDKSGYNILPVGSAGLAKAITKIQFDNTGYSSRIKHCPNCARLILSGSASQLTKNQIQKLKQEKEIFSVDLTTEDIIKSNRKIIETVCEKLSKNIDVIVHVSSILNKEKMSENTADVISENTEETLQNDLIDAGISKTEFANMITDFLSDLAREINLRQDFILVMAGGETSFKTLKKINSKYLQIIDAISPAVPLCVDSQGKVIVTKSGSFGTLNTLVDIINYFDKLRTL